MLRAVWVGTWTMVIVSTSSKFLSSCQCHTIIYTPYALVRKTEVHTIICIPVVKSHDDY
jgi:hypothetical protein